MNKTAKDLITLSILAGLGLAVLANPKGATKIIGSVSTAWFNIVRAASGGKKLIPPP